MPGIMYGDTLPVHNELDATAGAYVDAIAKGKLKKLTPVWKNGLVSIYDTYLGKYPEKFIYNGKEYTPKSFAESLGLNPDDYVSLTSYTHHPFYKQFSLEIQDNWRNASSWNIPLDEFMAVMDNAIKQGYTIACRPRNAKLVQKYKRALGAQEKAAIVKENEPLLYADLYEKYSYLNIKEWSVADVNGEIAQCGLSGSPTKVKTIQNISFQAKESRTLSGSDKDVEDLIVELLANHTIG